MEEESPKPTTRDPEASPLLTTNYGAQDGEGTSGVALFSSPSTDRFIIYLNSLSFFHFPLSQFSSKDR